jgi:hypothetical protein
VRAGAWNRDDGLAWLRVGEKALELEDVLREGVGGGRVAAERADRQQVCSGRPAEAEVDPARVECGQRPELLGDHDRRVVREHDLARADANRRRPAGDVRDHDRGRGACDPDRVVVLGEPEPLVAPGFGVLRQVERVPQRLARRRALDDRRQVEDGERGQRHRDSVPVTAHPARRLRSLHIV